MGSDSRSHFDLASAKDAARRGELEIWVNEYLIGPGRNEAFAVGLQLRRRFWLGPVLLPLTRLQRKCGPEPDMPFPVSAASWEQSISEIASSFVTLEAFPPLIVEYRSGAFLVSDGNHRVGAFSSLGISDCWVLLWYPDEFEKAHYDARRARGAS
jgi:hypothetical protein